MDMTGSCDGYVRKLWWICQGAVVVMSESCVGYVRELWWLCHGAVVDMQEHQVKFVNDGSDNSLCLLLLLTRTIIGNMADFEIYAIVPVTRPWALC